MAPHLSPRAQRRLRTALIAALASSASLGSQAHAQEVEVGYTAAFYAGRGTYATDRVSSAYLFNAVDVSGGPFRASVSVPLLTQRTRPLATDPLTNTALPETRSTGFGDPLIRLDVRVFQDGARTLQIGIAGSIKPPLVAASTGRGTGETDVAAGATVFKAIGPTSLFADLLYWSYGDPEGVEYADSLSYSVGMGRLLGGGRWAALLSIGGFSQGADGGTAPMQASVALLRMVARHQSIAVSAGAGLNAASEDFTAGVSWRIAR